MEREYSVPEQLSLDTLRDALGAAIEIDEPVKLLAGWLDSHDWRLAERGARLTRERSGRRTTLRWHAGGETLPYVLPAQEVIRFARDLPAGFLRSTLEPILEARALLEVGEARVERQTARLVDEDGNTTVQICRQIVQPLDASGAAYSKPVSRVWLRGLASRKRSLDLAVGALKAAGAGKADADDLELVAAARGRQPGDYSSKLRLQLDPDQRSDDALREILSTLLETLRANVEGVIADHDVEFLHDFRVATRRTRSALGQIKGVLPQRRVDPFVRDFKWLGTVTGPCRDLDVYLLEMATYRQMLSSQAELLAPLERLIETSRSRAHRAVVRGLESRRFARLIDRWSAFLAEHPAVKSEPPDADRPVAELAGARIFKAYRRMLKHGGRLGDDPPAEDLHRLRIDAKKLRYLLEFFSSLYPPKVAARLVKELKKLQDILGGFNDMQVQQARLVGFARELDVTGDRRTDTMLALGRLAAALEERQQDYRLAFAEGFEAFAGPASQKIYRRLCGGG